jgi:hypothetical protein
MIELLLNPSVLFFAVGILAVAMKSDLEIPASMSKMVCIYLVLCIGFRGGAELRGEEITEAVAATLICAMLMTLPATLISFYILKRRFSVPDAAAIGATYGSISPVTFITTAAFLEKSAVPFGGQMVAAMALMESPSIIAALILERIYNPAADSPRLHWTRLVKQSFFNESVFLLLTSLIVGFICGERGMAAMKPMVYGLFPGMVGFFMLDMGIKAAHRINDLRRAGAFLATFAILVPILNGSAALLISHLLELSPGNSLLFVMLCASSSYIVVPAALRYCLPAANPGIYMSMSLGLTFPMNITLGIPIYYFLILKWSS